MMLEEFRQHELAESGEALMQGGRDKRDIWMAFQNTRGCLGVYFIIMILNLAVVIWEVAGGKFHPGIIAIETLINSCMVIEQGINIFVYSWDYFRKYLNILDFLVTIVCLIFFILFFKINLPSGLESVFLAFRYILQLVRLATIAYRSRLRRDLLKLTEEIKFDHLDSIAMAGSIESLDLFASVSPSSTAQADAAHASNPLAPSSTAPSLTAFVDPARGTGLVHRFPPDTIAQMKLLDSSSAVSESLIAATVAASSSSSSSLQTTREEEWPDSSVLLGTHRMPPPPPLPSSSSSSEQHDDRTVSLLLMMSEMKDGLGQPPPPSPIAIVGGGGGGGAKQQQQQQQPFSSPTAASSIVVSPPFPSSLPPPTIRLTSPGGTQIDLLR